MAMVLRYVDDKCHVIERFVGVQHVTDTISSSPKDAIDTFFSSNGLSLSKLQGQGYDGVSNRRASYKQRDALRAQLQEELAIALENDCLITGRGLHQETSLKCAGDT
ncbi:unnamed protein product [Prunus armeniaca]